MTSSAAWPAYYPPGVPPPTATDAAGVGYRLVRTVPPTDVDFRSSFEDYAARGKTIPPDKLWKGCGTSLHTDVAGSRATRSRFPPLRQRRIVVGTLTAMHGKMMATDDGFHPSHVTVWFRVGAAPAGSFTTDAEVAP
jgi:hypothetical protein